MHVNATLLKMKVSQRCYERAVFGSSKNRLKVCEEHFTVLKNIYDSIDLEVLHGTIHFNASKEPL